MSQLIDINPQVIKRFATLNQKKRLAHAYLFTGPTGVGKKETALAVAKLINCEENLDGSKEIFCDQCPSCLKVNKGNHPDIHIIDVLADETIKIEQVRDLLEQIKLRPFQGVKKIFIICNTEKVTLEAGNALLKTLEEPSQNSLLLLTTSVLEKNLDTIVSRCHSVKLMATAKDIVARQLVNDYQTQPKEAHFLAYFTKGCLGQAKKLKEGQFLGKKNAIIDRFILTLDSEAFIKKILEDKEETKVFLDVLWSWIRDAMLIKAGVEDQRLINLDRVVDLNRFSLKFSFVDLRKINDDVINMRKLLAENLNIKIPLLIIKEALCF